LGPEGGMVVSLASVGNQVYLGTADGHIFFSADGANSWELRGRVGTRLDAVVASMVADPRGGRVFAAVWYQAPGAGGGVFESSDRGKTWRMLGLQTEAVRTLELAPSQQDELVAGTRTGVFLSPDAGKTWGRISREGDEEIRNLDSLAIDPRDARVIYAGTFHLPWLTPDGGKSWKPVSAGIIDDSDIMSLRLDAGDPDRVYMSACSGIYRSENQGAQWTKLQGIPYASRRTQVIVQDRANPKTLYAGTTEGLWVTRDGGESWARTTPRDWVVNSIVVLEGSHGGAGRVVLGTEGQGIEVSDDAGASFTTANAGFTHVIVKKIAADERGGRLLMIAQRGAAEILESQDDGRSWSDLPWSADDHGKTAPWNADEVEEVFGSPWGWMVRLPDGGFWIFDERRKDGKPWKPWKPFLSFSSSQNGHGTARNKAKSALPRPIKAVAIAAFSTTDALVLSKEGLLRCQQSGSCRTLPAFPSVQICAASASGSSVPLIAVVGDQMLGFSSDGGATASWRDLPVAAQQVQGLDIAQAPNGMALYLVTSEGVYVSHGGGAWQPLAAGLPAGRVNHWLRADLWVATERDGGFYVSTDRGASWNRADQDAERGEFTGLVMAQDGAVLVGSQSEGLLRFVASAHTR